MHTSRNGYNFFPIFFLILADNIMIIASGPRMLDRFGGPLNMTHEYLQDMGAVAAPDKSYNFASNKEARKKHGICSFTAGARGCKKKPFLW